MAVSTKTKVWIALLGLVLFIIRGSAKKTLPAPGILEVKAENGS